MEENEEKIVKSNKTTNKITIILVSTIALIVIAAVGYATVTTSKNKKETGKEQTTAATEEKDKVNGSSKKPKGTAGGLTGIETTVSTAGNGRKTLEGYEIIGEIEIPKVDLKCTILSEVTSRSIEIAVATMHTSEGLNKPGNTVIYGHNYRNSLFFSRNDELEIGDVFYITDEFGERKEYEIYDIFETVTSDTSFYARTAEMTGGKAEATLSTCTDDASETERRLIVVGREKEIAQ